MISNNRIRNIFIRFIQNNSEKTDEEIQIIQYGIEIMLLNVFKIMLLFFTAFILGVLNYTFVAFISFGLLRTFACGVHASTSTRCILINYLIFLGNVYLSSSFLLSKNLVIILFILVLIIVVVYAPADTEERPLVSRKLRTKLKIRSILVVLIIFILILFMPTSIYSNLLTYSMLEEAILITPIAYKVFRKSYKNFVNVDL